MKSKEMQADKTLRKFYEKGRALTGNAEAITEDLTEEESRN